MYPELKQFNQISKDYEERIKEANDRWKILHKQKEMASSEYESLLGQYGRRNSRVSMEALHESKDEYLRLLAKERDAMEHLDELKETRRDRMKDFVNTLHQARDREVDAATRTMKKKIEEMHRLKAEYLMIVQQIHQIHQYVNEIEESTLKAFQTMDSRYQQKTDYSIYPALAKMEISHREIQQVFTAGKLPSELTKYTDPYSSFHLPRKK
ncbi:hypothetical protein LCY76_04925 [Fictibacillus sp. KIGAM418]|uniref:Uncharacterized protein n=1 Tax=Fictibacillus marinisediminis TaxID=2878389 RepID=A0A9X1X9A7_9BACL|nr:hypothetical protein [Fictibacillus marinisediminis]MCK6255946.1 hypothetical protein [Fictibacillus marinisediminis]